MHSLSEAHHSAVLRPQGQGIVSTVQKVVYDLNYTKTKAIGLLSKQKEKGFLETAKIGKSLGIPYFKTISVCFYLFRDRRHTVSTCVSLSKLICISSSMIGSLNLMDLSH